MIKKNYKGGAAKQLRDIFNSYLDLDNYVRIVRMKTFYKAPPEAIRDALLPFTPLRVQYDTANHHIHFSTHPSVVLLSYIFVKQAEVYDIITILEGIRYHLAPSKIAKLLTIVNFQ